MVVAHCDDDCLWGGGLLIRFAHLGWTVISCSIPRIDNLRAWRFFDVCAALGATARLFPVTESPPGQDLAGLEHIGLSAFDCIVTHGEHGEYGHNQHAQLHRHIVENYPGRVLGFGWHRGGQGALKVSLTADETMMKDAALDCYGAKADALRKRYFGELGVPEDRETFDVYRA